MEEIWKSIKGYEGVYEISNRCNVRSLKFEKIRILRQGISQGYMLVKLCLNGKAKSYLTHRLLYEAFVEQIPEGMQIDHIDGNRMNNDLSNLRCLNNQENTQAALDRKRASGKLKSKHRCVSLKTFDKYTYWNVRIRINDKNMSIGSYKNEEDARMAAEEASRGIYPQKFIDRLAKKGIVIGK